MVGEEPRLEGAPKQKGIAFVFSYWTEKDNPNEIDDETKRRLDKAIELYKEGKIAYFLVTGGEFTKDADKPFAKMMTAYLVSMGIPEDVVVEEQDSVDTDPKKAARKRIILEERHSLDTPTNIRFGKFLIGLKKLHDLPIYYVSSDVHLKRVKTLVEGQGKAKPDDKYIEREGAVELKGVQKIKEILNTKLNKSDPKGKSPLARYIRKKRHHPIPHPELRNFRDS